MKLRERKPKSASVVATATATATGKKSERKRKNDRSTPKTKKRKQSVEDTSTKDDGASSRATAEVSTSVSIQAFIDSIENEEIRQGVQNLHEMIIEEAPSLVPTLEFKDKLGYGKYHYKYKSGREGDWVKVAIATNKATLALHCCALVDGKYVVEGFEDRLSKHANLGKSCVRFSLKKLKTLPMELLKELVRATESADIMT